jgi:flavin-dependent dehydrogenase
MAYSDPQRPAKYEGHRQRTAFQVDRSIYDKILLDRARELGCTVLEGVGITAVSNDGERVNGFELDATSKGKLPPEWNGNATVTADYYCDCTGGSLFRRTLGIEIDSPTSLRNVAAWDYWQNAEWAVNIGTGGTRIQVMSLGWGWLWFIPVGKTRTSIGLVTPAEHLRQSGKKLEELYNDAIAAEPLIAKLTQDATCEHKFATTRDWSFISERVSGENWFLAGDSAGFADPILSAGLTLAQSGARRAAFTILELRKGEKNPEWLHREYNATYKFQVGHHIRFADYWYSANAVFTDLRENCSKIAADAGLNLDAEDAFRWLSTGGFARDVVPGVARAAGWNLGHVRHMVDRFSDDRTAWQISTNNVFQLNVDKAQQEYIAFYDMGQVHPVRCYVKGKSQLPLLGLYEMLAEVLGKYRDMRDIADVVWRICQKGAFGENPSLSFARAMETLEAMIVDGWVLASLNPKRPLLRVEFQEEGYMMEFVDPG